MASDKMVEVAEWSRQPQYQKSNVSAQSPPVPLMLGEYQILVSKTSDGSAVVTNFRFFVFERQSFINVPLMMIGELTVTEAAKRLRIGCKDGTSYGCTFATPEDFRQCSELLKEKWRIPRQIAEIFAYRFYFHVKKKEQAGAGASSLEKEQIELCQPVPEQLAYSFGKEVERLGFDCSKNKVWKMSHANENFEFCPTYPKYHILPATVENDKLKNSTDFRAGKRFPSVVWRDKSSGVVLIRSSQPLPSFLGLSYYSNEADVFLLDEIVRACNRDRQLLLASQNSAAAEADVKTCDSNPQRPSGKVDNSQQVSPTSANERQVKRSSPHNSSSPARGHSLMSNRHKECNGNSAHVEPVISNCQLAIVDCRSLAMVWGNSLKGGGTEDENLYKCNIIHLDLANIHTVRDSFSKLRSMCHFYQDGSYYKVLSGCMWLNYISSLLKGANTVVKLMHVDKRPVLVHCSDGWDRTAQIVSLSELMMDPHYRTIQGFQVLVEREWLAFGHKFGERGGHDPACSDQNQQSPIFLQFLDCVYQLTLQYPSSFQFNEAFLVKLLRHSQACLFGTFLHNSDRERERCPHKTASVWSLLRMDNPQFLNLLYKDSDQILTARCGEHEVVLWTSVYMAPQSPSIHGSPKDFSAALATGEDGDDDPAANEGFSRSKSMDDLSKASVDCGRRNSDPNLAQTPDSTVTGTSAPIHDTSSSSAEILHISDSPPMCGFQPEENGSSSSDFQEVEHPTPSKDRHGAEGRLESWSGSFESASSSLEAENALSKNGLNSCGKNGHVTTLEDDCGGDGEKISNGIDASGPESFSSCNDGIVSDSNATEPKGERSAETEHNKAEDNKPDLDCDRLCNGIENTVSKISHSSSRSSPSEERPVSLLSERLAKCPASGKPAQVNGISSAASFHHVTRAPNLENASSEDRKILALKQTQQMLIRKAHTSPDITGLKCNDEDRSVEHSPLETNGHSTPVTEENSLNGNGNLNSMSTDTLVGDSEEVGVPPSPTRQAPVTCASDISVDVDQSIVASPLASLPTSALSSGLRTGSPNTGATAPIPRRTRTGSGASIDSSVSPCVCRGWSDTGRLRNPSGGESSVRRWIGSSISTSTTDISDSCIGKVSPPVMERQAGLRQLLDVDGLTLFADQRHELLIDLVTEKDKKIGSLEARLKQALETIHVTRNMLMSQQPGAPMDELLLTETEGGEFSSLGAHSNPASDASWEQLDESEEKIVEWMPDEAVTHCAGCDRSFWFAHRKHHCRNCGKIFCSECSNFMAPLAGIYHNKPQRVCGRCHARLMQLSPGASCDGRIPTLVADG